MSVLQTILKGAGAVLRTAGQWGPLLAQVPVVPHQVSGAAVLVAEFESAETTLANLQPGESFQFPPFHLDLDGHGPDSGGTVTITYTKA